MTTNNPDRQDHYSGSCNHWRFSRSQGPGPTRQQNNPRAELRIDIQQTDFLSPRLPNDYELRPAIVPPLRIVLTSQRFREQNRNINDCLEKLSALLIKALALPKLVVQPNQRASKTRRLEKKHRAATKNQAKNNRLERYRPTRVYSMIYFYWNDWLLGRKLLFLVYASIH